MYTVSLTLGKRKGPKQSFKLRIEVSRELFRRAYSSLWLLLKREREK
jgi:hypothetical protein